MCEPAGRHRLALVSDSDGADGPLDGQGAPVVSGRYVGARDDDGDLNLLYSNDHRQPFLSKFTFRRS